MGFPEGSNHVTVHSLKPDLEETSLEKAYFGKIGNCAFVDNMIHNSHGATHYYYY